MGINIDTTAARKAAQDAHAKAEKANQTAQSAIEEANAIAERIKVIPHTNSMEELDVAIAKAIRG